MWSRWCLPPSRDYRARPEQLVLIMVSAWDVNCPQHIPQKLDAAASVASSSESPRWRRRISGSRASKHDQGVIL